MLDAMYKEKVVYKEREGIQDGKPVWSVGEELPAIELGFTQTLRDIFGNVEANTVFQVRTNKRLNLQGTLTYNNEIYDIKIVQILKDPNTLEIVANYILV